MNELQIFNNAEFGEVRTVEINGEPWFIASDICKALELSNTTVAMERLDDDEKSKFNLGLSGGDTNCVNEYGLYTLVLASRKENARRFKRWITHDVIPQIRQTGGYHLPQTYAEALRALADKAEQAEQLRLENEEMKPKALFADAVEASDTTLLVREYSKFLNQNGIDIGEKRLYKWFVDNKYLIKKYDGYEPTQRAMDLKVFEISERVVDISGENRLKRTVRVTGRGQTYFINKFLERG